MSEDIKVNSEAVQETIKLITDGSITGNGIFDTCMLSAEKHINDYFKNNALDKKAVAQAYVALIPPVLQASMQLATTLQDSDVQRELSRVQLEKAKVELEAAKLDVERARIQLEQAKWQELLAKAQVCDIIDNGEECYTGENFNIHGLQGQQYRTSKAAREQQEKAAALSLANSLVLNPFQIMESAEGVSPSYYGIQGTNGIDVINNLRKTYGLDALDTKTYAGEFSKYMNTYAPGAVVESDEDD